MARAAIAAMREPSAKMIEAGRAGGDMPAEFCYETMIDAALSGD